MAIWDRFRLSFFMTEPVTPRSLADAGARIHRRELLRQPHIAPLSQFAATLRDQHRGAVPEFDPLDGGVGARVLFLFEKPGPMTDETAGEKRPGSGFISRDNHDPTAEATFRFMEKAGIPRRKTVIWNVVPWWNGTRRITAAELRDGVAAADTLFKLLPDLRGIMLVGRKAARVSSLLEHRGVHLFESAHPSPIVRATRPNTWNSIPNQWGKVVPLFAEGR